MELPLHVVSETLDVAAIAEDVGEPEEPVPEQTWLHFLSASRSNTGRTSPPQSF